MYDVMADNRSMAVLKRLSRVLNGLTGGDPREMFCARAFRADYRGEGRLVRTIDAIMFRLYGERDHCKSCALYEFMLRGCAEDEE